MVNRIPEIDDLLHDYHKRFPGRSSYNPVYNTVKQAKEITGGLEYLWNAARTGNIKLNKDIVPMLGAGVVEGTLQNYGQTEAMQALRNAKGGNVNSKLVGGVAKNVVDYAPKLRAAAKNLNPAAAAASFVANPLNVLDFVGAGKAVGIGKSLKGAKAIANVATDASDAGKAAKIIKAAKVAGTGEETAKALLQSKGLVYKSGTKAVKVSTEGLPGGLRSKVYEPSNMAIKAAGGTTKPILAKRSVKSLLSDVKNSPRNTWGAKYTENPSNYFKIPDAYVKKVPLTGRKSTDINILKNLNPKFKVVEESLKAEKPSIKIIDPATAPKYMGKRQKVELQPQRYVAKGEEIPYLRTGVKFSDYGKVGKAVDKWLGSPYDFPAKLAEKETTLGKLETPLAESSKLAKQTFLSTPSWFVTNRIGNTLMKAMEENPAEFIRSYGQFLTNPDARKMIPKEIMRGFARQGQTGTFLDKMSNMNPVYNVESKAEAMDRGAHYLTQLERMAKETGLNPREIANNDALRQEMLARTTRTMGDYTSPSMLGGKANLIDLFYGWQRAILKATANKAIERPGRVATLKGLGAYSNNAAQAQKAYLESMGRQSFDNMDYGAIAGQDQQGNPELYTEQRAFPLSTIKEEADMLLNPSLDKLGSFISNPLIQIPYKVFAGKTGFGRDVTSPNITPKDFRGNRYYKDPDTGEYRKVDTGLPPKEMFKYLVSELFRNYGSLAPSILNQYRQTTGESPYDTQVWNINPNKKRHVKDWKEALFGIGTYGSAYPKKELDTEAIDESLQKQAEGKSFEKSNKKKGRKKKSILESVGGI